MEAAEDLLGRIVVLGDIYPDGWVEDTVLYEEVNLSYEDYVAAAAELVRSGLAVTIAGDYSFLRATPEGRTWVQSL